MTTADIAALRELMAKASARPWRVHLCRPWDKYQSGYACGIKDADQDPKDDDYQRGVVVDTNRDECHHAMDSANAALIVAAVNALPGLLDEVERYYKLLPLVQIGMVPLDDEAQTRAAEREAIAAWLERTDTEMGRVDHGGFLDWAADEIRAGRHVKETR